MTTEELNKTIKEAEFKYNSELSRLKTELELAKKEAYTTWAEENASFKIGDVIAYPDSDTRIRIEKIGGGYSAYTGKYYVIYYGPNLTKKLTVMKNGNPHFSMYEDGREIIKLN